MNGIFPQYNLTLTATRFVAALMLVVFLFATAVEASACAIDLETETSQTVSISLDNQDSDHSDEKGEQHAVCAHGHCHHVGKIVSPLLASARNPVMISMLGFSHDNIQTSDFISRLKRPPRV
ncbi:hypothetical protein LPB140_10355 [Sphingorhabdus lutea]|uniref:Uncharacterized protein n=1 Tax=Sphingorhabdus lutea TaxID=1913578 RepID=A0A1L3JDE9_9SPHN|nr:hypothetical protein [Sphingorhabdus lutea]APG63119.1 hypothetical protein LPB140_10355 [Sphingorhabdus lutea]